MTQPHLRLVANKATSLRPRVLHFDLGAVCARSLSVLRCIKFALMLPIWIITGAGRLCVTAGRGFLIAVINCFLGLIGITVIAVLGNALVHMLFFPLFHH